MKLISFSFRKNMTPVADVVLDVRHLPNPHSDPTLRPLDGRDRRVQTYALRDQEELARMVRHARKALPDGTVAVGCFGGRHRSVALVEALAAVFSAEGETVTVQHMQLGNAGRSQ